MKFDRWFWLYYTPFQMKRPNAFHLVTPLLLSILSGVTVAEEAGTPGTVLLFPEGAPGAVGEDEIDKPSLTLYPAPRERNTGAAVLVCPGGGYATLAINHEGHEVAEWFNSFGVSAFVLKYRLGKRYHHPAPLQDVQQALLYLRANHADHGIDPNRVGVMGFSAGGHLASSAGTHWVTQEVTGHSPVSATSRPDFMILVYPVITFTTDYAHKGSRLHLLGENPKSDLVEYLSNEKQVTAETPPTFLIHADDDRGVPPENSILFYMALRKAGVPAELHIYREGGHGFGMAPQDAVLSSWTDRLKDWMEESGWLIPLGQEN